MKPLADIGVVVIGRNEGERLARCLRSCQDAGASAIVYIDSGSSDGSVARARAMGVDVIELDLSRPFTAARARNEGFDRLLSLRDDLLAVQFVDGDCEIAPGWLDAAAGAMRARPDAAVVCGRLRERFPDASIYNRLCDIEWSLPLGEIDSSGGVAMMRASAFEASGGFEPELIAGEEPELCVRLRASGHKILRIDHEMALHDAAMTRFAQWWRRTVRAGHAYAEGAALHGRAHWARASMSNWWWGALLPVVALALAWPTRGVSLLVAAALYLCLALKAGWASRARAEGAGRSMLYGLFCVIAKPPMALGQARYWAGRLTGKRSAIIEHKPSPAPRAAAAAPQPAPSREPVAHGADQ